MSFAHLLSAFLLTAKQVFLLPGNAWLTHQTLVPCSLSPPPSLCLSLMHRIYLGYHSISQVIFGILLGGVMACIWFAVVQVREGAQLVPVVLCPSSDQVAKVVVSKLNFSLGFYVLSYF